MLAIAGRHPVCPDIGAGGVLGFEATSAEDGAGWLASFRGLVAPDIKGIAPVAAIQSTLPDASWQR
jgi:putative transposase